MVGRSTLASSWTAYKSPGANETIRSNADMAWGGTARVRARASAVRVERAIRRNRKPGQPRTRLAVLSNRDRCNRFAHERIHVVGREPQDLLVAVLGAVMIAELAGRSVRSGVLHSDRKRHVRKARPTADGRL